MTFEKRDGKTLLTIVQIGFESKEDRDGVERGWPSILDALERVVADQQIHLTRRRRRCGS